MKLIQMTISYGQTQSLPEYSNVKPLISLTATLDEDDDPVAIEALLWMHAKATIYEQIDAALEANDRAAKYSLEPRYRLIRTYGDSYYRRGKPELPKIVAIIPDGLKFKDDRFSTPHYGVAEMRHAHALRMAEQYAHEHGYTLMDLADGDLAALLAALPEDPPEEPKPAPFVSPLDDEYHEIEEEDDDLDEEDEEDEEDEA